MLVLSVVGITSVTTIYVVPVFHVGGNLVRNDDGDLVYEGGRVEKLEDMDDHDVNFGDLVKLLASLGFISIGGCFGLMPMLLILRLG
ncbi:hypothetical protein PIB30_047830 [Stylosanthes scabra]|uniref:PB1-like domain-containing protein n=1 Tax=Stylosanthes scabra TaxID=79078 RepID=A0ABU6ZFL6_9FABA|nr:hypothetical protein [Stylosanthes scabra]